MKKYIIYFLLLNSPFCLAQEIKWQISGGLGLSGVNQIIKNDVILDGHVKFRAKNNLLNNKFRNNALHTGYIRLSKFISKGILKDNIIDFSVSMYNFRSIYFKEDKFPGTNNDTINTPNWLTSKYTLPYIESCVSRELKIQNTFLFKIGLFFSYQIDYYGTSHLILNDKLYYLYERHTFLFDEENPNSEFNHFNYGIRASASIFATKRLHPEITWTQSLHDISREEININQHANIWSLTVGLTYNLWK